MKVYLFIIFTNILLLSCTEHDIFAQFEENAKKKQQIGKKNKGGEVVIQKSLRNVKNNIVNESYKMVSRKIRMVNGKVVEEIEETRNIMRNGDEIYESINKAVRKNRVEKPKDMEEERQKKLKEFIEKRKIRENLAKIADDKSQREYEERVRKNKEKMNGALKKKTVLDSSVKKSVVVDSSSIKKKNDLKKFMEERNKKIKIRNKDNRINDDIEKEKLRKKKISEEKEKQEREDMTKKLEANRAKLRIKKENAEKKDKEDAYRAKILNDLELTKKKEKEDAYRAKIFKDLESPEKKIPKPSFKSKIIKDQESPTKKGKQFYKGIFQNNEKKDNIVKKDDRVNKFHDKYLDDMMSRKNMEPKEEATKPKRKILNESSEEKEKPQKPDKLFANINAGMKDKSGNLDRNTDFRPIQIVYDTNFLKETLTSLGKMNLYGDFKQLLMKCDMIFKRYLKVHKDVNQRILVERNYQKCESSNGSSFFNFEPENYKKQMIYNADLVIFVAAYSDLNTSIIASALPCQKSRDGNNRSIIGRIIFNIPKMDLDQNDGFKYKQSLQTTIHELFHVLAFHSYIQKDFVNNPNLKTSQPHLNKLAVQFNKKKNQVSPLINNAHWSERYLVNDLMLPSTSNDAILSIFSLEYVDLATTDITTDITKTENNPMMAAINNSYWNYDCKADNRNKKKSQYPWLCTKWEFSNDAFGCSSDYTARTTCSNSFDTETECGSKFVLSNGNCRNSKSLKKHDYEVFSDKSRCFSLGEMFGSVCLEFEIKNTNEIHLIIEGKTLVCKSGETVDFIFTQLNDQGKKGKYQDTIRCPDFNDFKKEFDKNNCPYNCNFNGVCVEGECDCYAGWNPNDDCASRLGNSSGVYSTMFMEV